MVTLEVYYKDYLDDYDYTYYALERNYVRYVEIIDSGIVENKTILFDSMTKEIDWGSKK